MAVSTLDLVNAPVLDEDAGAGVEDRPVVQQVDLRDVGGGDSVRGDGDFGELPLLGVVGEEFSILLVGEQPQYCSAARLLHRRALSATATFQ